MKFLEPIEVGGHKFDRAMTLFEFDAFREPEKTRFPLIGEWLKERVEMVEVPTPQMYWRGRFWPDLYIANQLDALRDTDFGMYGMETFEEEFLEPMCRKISGRSYAEMDEQYHRALWLPLYWPETLRARESLRTPFWYPKAGYAGAVVEGVGAGMVRAHGSAVFDQSSVSVSFIRAKPKVPFSVLFVVDESPIYRITDQDVCAGLDVSWHRWVVEHRGPLELLSAWTDGFGYFGTKELKLTLPTIENVARGWKPLPNINDYLFELMNASQRLPA